MKNLTGNAPIAAKTRLMEMLMTDATTAQKCVKHADGTPVMGRADMAQPAGATPAKEKSMTQTDDAMKACPFCGSPAAYRLQSDEGQQNDYDTIGCTACPAEMWRLLGDMDRAGDHRLDLTADWNTRADLATQPDPLADQIAKALREITTCVEDGCYCSEMKMAAAVDEARAALAAFNATGGKDE